MKLELSRLALADLERIGEWIAKDKPDRAKTYLEEIIADCERLVLFPLSGEEIGRYKKEAVRRKVHDDYLVLYVVRQNILYVVRVLNAAQDYTRFLD